MTVLPFVPASESLPHRPGEHSYAGEGVEGREEEKEARSERLYFW